MSYGWHLSGPRCWGRWSFLSQLHKIHLFYPRYGSVNTVSRGGTILFLSYLCLLLEVASSGLARTTYCKHTGQRFNYCSIKKAVFISQCCLPFCVYSILQSLYSLGDLVYHIIFYIDWLIPKGWLWCDLAMLWSHFKSMYFTCSCTSVLNPIQHLWKIPIHCELSICFPFSVTFNRGRIPLRETPNLLPSPSRFFMGVIGIPTVKQLRFC